MRAIAHVQSVTGPDRDGHRHGIGQKSLDHTHPLSGPGAAFHRRPERAGGIKSHTAGKIKQARSRDHLRRIRMRLPCYCAANCIAGLGQTGRRGPEQGQAVAKRDFTLNLSDNILRKIGNLGGQTGRDRLKPAPR
jgi:hypothetical protein